MVMEWLGVKVVWIGWFLLLIERAIWYLTLDLRCLVVFLSLVLEVMCI